MAFVEDFAPYFADFGVAGTLAGTAVRGLLDVETVDDFGVVTQTTSYLMEPTTAVTPAVGQALVADGVTYTVRQVQLEPPDGALRRLVLTRA